MEENKETITTSDLESLIRMVFLDGGTFSMLLHDGFVKGQIGKTHLFKIKSEYGFTTLYRIEIMSMDETVEETYIFHRHSSRIPKDMPGKSMELYRIDSDALSQSGQDVNSSRGMPKAYRNPSGRPEVDFKHDNPLKLVLRM